MWYFAFGVLCAVALVLDARERRVSDPFGWALGVVAVPFVFVPVYRALRPLKTGETREGGRAWNVLRGFVLMWTVIIAVAAAAGLAHVSSLDPGSGGETGRAGSAIGLTITLGFYGALWFFPVVGALVLGLFLKQASVIEKGPTGPLAAVTIPEVSNEVSTLRA